MDGKATYEKIAGHYRTLILSGGMNVGDRLPTFLELGETWNVTKATAGRAIEQLRLEGLVTTDGRHGTRVRGVAETTVAIALAYRGLMVRETRVIDAVPHVALELGVEPGTQLLVVKLSAGRSGDDVLQERPQPGSGMQLPQQAEAQAGEDPVGARLSH